MLAKTKIQESNSEWEKIERLNSELSPQVKNISPKINSNVFIEYDKLCNTVILEHIRLMRISYEIQKSNTEMISDYMNMYGNFFRLGFDWNSKISSFYTR